MGKGLAGLGVPAEQCAAFVDQGFDGATAASLQGEGAWGELFAACGLAAEQQGGGGGGEQQPEQARQRRPTTTTTAAVEV